MPYSDHLKFVHIAIPKTGSTSVVAALKQLHTTHGAELLLHREMVDEKFRRAHGLDQLPDRVPSRTKHLSASQLRAILTEKYERYFVFSFVRNPWARTVSRYMFTHVSHEPCEEEKVRRNTLRHFHAKTFDEWVRDKAASAEKKGAVPLQLDKLSGPDGRLIVDFVGKLESLNEDFAHVCNRLGVPPIPVPHVNRTSHAHYTDFYNRETAHIVGVLYARDIETFGYEFRGPAAGHPHPPPRG